VKAQKAKNIDNFRAGVASIKVAVDGFRKNGEN